MGRMFEAQAMGITWDWSEINGKRGKVVALKKGGQGDRLGAELGWYFYKLDQHMALGDEKPEDLVFKACDGHLPFNITFLHDSLKYVCPSSPFWGESAVLDD